MSNLEKYEIQKDYPHFAALTVWKFRCGIYNDLRSLTDVKIRWQDAMIRYAFRYGTSMTISDKGELMVYERNVNKVVVLKTFSRGNWVMS